KIVVNAPFAVLLLAMLGGYFGTIITAAVAGRATFQDVDHDTTAFFYCAPISKLDYLGGGLLWAPGGMLPVYVGAVVLVLGYLIAGSLISNIDNRSLAALLDPFGGGAAERLTEYWTIAEKNTRLVPLTGVFLWNRVLWTGVGLAFLVLTYVRFSFSAPAGGKVKRAPEGLVELAPPGLPLAPTLD